MLWPKYHESLIICARASLRAFRDCLLTKESYCGLSGPSARSYSPARRYLDLAAGLFCAELYWPLDLSVQLRQIVQARLTAGRSFGVSPARNCWKPDMSNPPNECRRQVLACVRLAQASTSAKDRVAFAKLAKIWLSLASDLEELDRQLKSEPEKRKTG